jgi:hypothetical protein
MLQDALPGDNVLAIINIVIIRKLININGYIDINILLINYSEFY